MCKSHGICKVITCQSHGEITLRVTWQAHRAQAGISGMGRQRQTQRGGCICQCEWAMMV